MNRPRPIAPHSCLCLRVAVFTLAALSFTPQAQAQAQQAAPAPSPFANQPQTQPPQALTPPGERQVADGPRFRFGVAGGGGGEFVDDFSAWLVGLDFRLGVQINNLVGVYIQPHLSVGAGTAGTLSGNTGTAAAIAMVDFTFSDRFFAGAGFGYGVVNNPRGPALALRGGAYPIISRAPHAPRRRALMVSGELRTYFTEVGTVVQIMAMIGYERF